MTPAAASANLLSADTHIGPNDQAVRPELLSELWCLPFHAFEACLLELLRRMGYCDVRMLGRKSWRQRTHHGGLDIEAYSQTGVTRSLIIVQAKQYTRPVQRRFVDELRGVMLRTGAKQGLLISTSRFPRVAETTAKADRLAPVRLLDGNELLDLLIRYGVGVLTESDETLVDRQYFADLRTQFPGSTRKKSTLVLNSTPQQDSSAVPVVGQLRLNPLPVKGGDMMARTHILLGISTVWLLEAIPQAVSLDNVALLSTAAAFGALLPDLDAAESTIQALSIGGMRPFAPFGSLAYRTWGHRGFLHSPWALMLLGGLLTPLGILWSWPVITALWLGYASHLFADAATKTGIPGWISNRRFYVLPAKLRIRTGSSAEDVLFPFLVAAVLFLLFHHLFSR